VYVEAIAGQPPGALDTRANSRHDILQRLAGAARRPVAVLMVVAAVVVFGAVSYNRLDLALLPDLVERARRAGDV